MDATAETAALLQPVWDIILNSGWVEVPLFEAYVAAAAFFVWISWFHFLKIHRWFSKWRFPSREVAVPFEQSDISTVLSLPVYLAAIKFYHAFLKTKTRTADEGVITVR